ncbi:Ig-like domain-containing protein [soil metagenome]
MHKFLFRRTLPALVLLLLLSSSCALVLTPDGGPKDTTPPRVVKYKPDSAATNFTGNKIVLEFDEYIQLKDLNNQLIISPQLKNDPDVIIRRKEIIITLNDTLLPNTTYSISFGNSIRDITEENVLDNFRYVFSTGPQIDSLLISGKVVNAASLAGEKGILVMLYTNTGDSSVLNQRPYYFAKTRADGTFTMTNLRAGKYKMVALDDKNSNYYFDNAAERVAFVNEPIDLTGKIDTINLKMFNERAVKQTQLKAQQLGVGRVNFAYALPLKDPHVTTIPALPAGMDMFQELSANGDTIDLWLSNVLLDSAKFIVRDEATGVNDSITITFVKAGDKKRRSGAVDQRKLTLTTNTGGQLFELGQPLKIYANNPLRTFNAKDFILLKGKDTLKTNPVLSENKHVVTFNYTFAEDSSYRLFVEPGAAIDWFGQKNDTLKLFFKIRESRYYGLLNVKMTGLPAGNYLLQLVNEKDQVFREQKVLGASTATFELLPPGMYRLKLISDENNNGHWDSGNYWLHQQPERIIYYINPVKIRSGWDMDVEWIFK